MNSVRHILIPVSIRAEVTPELAESMRRHGVVPPANFTLEEISTTNCLTRNEIREQRIQAQICL